MMATDKKNENNSGVVANPDLVRIFQNSPFGQNTAIRNEKALSAWLSLNTNLKSLLAPGINVTGKYRYYSSSHSDPTQQGPQEVTLAGGENLKVRSEIDQPRPIPTLVEVSKGVGVTMKAPVYGVRILGMQDSGGYSTRVLQTGDVNMVSFAPHTIVTATESEAVIDARAMGDGLNPDSSELQAAIDKFLLGNSSKNPSETINQRFNSGYTILSSRIKELTDKLNLNVQALSKTTRKTITGSFTGRVPKTVLDDFARLKLSNDQLTNLQAIYQSMIAQGFTPAFASAALLQAFAESKFKADAVNYGKKKDRNNPVAIGLFQIQPTTLGKPTPGFQDNKRAGLADTDTTWNAQDPQQNIDKMIYTITSGGAGGKVQALSKDPTATVADCFLAFYDSPLGVGSRNVSEKYLASRGLTKAEWDAIWLNAWTPREKNAKAIFGADYDSEDFNKKISAEGAGLAEVPTAPESVSETETVPPADQGNAFMQRELTAISGTTLSPSDGAQSVQTNFEEQRVSLADLSGTLLANGIDGAVKVSETQFKDNDARGMRLYSTKLSRVNALYVGALLDEMKSVIAEDDYVTADVIKSIYESVNLFLASVGSAPLPAPDVAKKINAVEGSKETYTPVFPVSDAKGYEVYGGMAYGKNLTLTDQYKLFDRVGISTKPDTMEAIETALLLATSAGLDGVTIFSKLTEAQRAALAESSITGETLDSMISTRKQIRGKALARNRPLTSLDMNQSFSGPVAATNLARIEAGSGTSCSCKGIDGAYYLEAYNGSFAAIEQDQVQGWLDNQVQAVGKNWASSRSALAGGDK
jgi:hypothetical protein